MTDSTQGCPCGISQKTGSCRAMGAGVGVDPGQQQTGKGDIDFFGRTKIPLDRNFDDGPNPSSIFEISLMDGQRRGDGQITTVFNHGFAIKINRILGVINGFIQRISSREAARQIGNHDPERRGVGSRFDGD